MNERTMFDKAFEDLTVTAKNLPDAYNLLHQRADRVKTFKIIEKSISDMTTSAGMFDVSVGVPSEVGGTIADQLDAALKAIADIETQIEQGVGGGAIPEDVENRIVTLENAGASSTGRLDTLEQTVSNQQTQVSALGVSVSGHSSDISNHNQRLGTVEVFFEDDPDKGLIIKGSKFIDSMVASELFSTDTSGGGTSAGGRRTEINFSQDVAAGTNIELMPGAYASYTVTGVKPNIPNATALVTSPFIRMTLGPLEVDKETLTFVDTTTIQFGVSIVSGTKVVLYS